MWLSELFRTRWVLGRVPMPEMRPDGLSPAEANDQLLEIRTGGWEPLGYDPVGMWVVIRRKETFREKLAAFLGGGADRQPASQETGGHQESVGAMSEWTPADSHRVLDETG